MKYMFWNTYNNDTINKYLVNMIKNLECDIIALAEYSDDVNELLNELEKVNLNFFAVPKIACERIQLLTKMYPEKIDHFNESNYYTIKGIPHETLGYHFIAFVHLPSKMNNRDSNDIMAELMYLRNDLEKIEADYNNRNSIIVGDFNINPYESPMISALGAHSLPVRDIVLKGKRIVLNKEYHMFYNPMWNFFGDIDNPPGTYYYSASVQVNNYWNIFDQVIIRPDVISNFDLQNLKIITEVQHIKLLSNNNIPNKSISDHLPIFFKIN